MVGPQELVTPPFKYNKEDYLGKLPEVDRQNIERLTELFTQVMIEKGRTGLLLAIGGTLTKSLPRKDIDLAIAFQQQPGDPVDKDHPNSLSFFTAEYRIFQGIIAAMLERDPSFQINSAIEPYIDNERPDLYLIAHAGNVVVVNKDRGGTLLEFSREYTFNRDETMEELISQRKKPFVVLASVTPSGPRSGG